MAFFPTIPEKSSVFYALETFRCCIWTIWALGELNGDSDASDDEDVDKLDNYSSSCMCISKKMIEITEISERDAKMSHKGER